MSWNQNYNYSFQLDVKSWGSTYVDFSLVLISYFNLLLDLGVSVSILLVLDRFV